MANLSSIARPYAFAAFEVARQAKEISQWQIFLETAAQIAKDPSLARLLNNPEISTKELYDLFANIMPDMLDDERRNFLLLIAQNRRFQALPEIVLFYQAYVAELDKISNVRVVTAVPVSDTYKEQLAQALRKRIQRDVTLHCEIDPLIIGGAIIHIGDSVIDGSIRGKLTRLLEFSLR